MTAVPDHPLFPAFLRLSGQPCLLVGGDAVALGRAEALLKVGARLTVVAREPVPEIVALAGQGRLVWLDEPFRPEQLDGVWLAVSALADRAVNARIHAEAQARRVPLNVVDQPDFCSFYWPALVERTPVVVAFSTGGSSPVLAGYLRQRLEAWLHPETGRLAAWLAGWRQRVAPRLPDLAARGRFWRRLLERGLAERYLAGEVEAAEGMIREALDGGPDAGPDGG